MARFRGTVGSVSRLGHTKTGLRVTCNGWHSGVTVQAGVRDDDGPDPSDEFSIYVTRGSNPRGGSDYIGRVILKDGEPTFVPVEK